MATTNGHTNAAANGTTLSLGVAEVEKPKYGDMRDYVGPNLFQPHQARKAIRDAHEGKRPPLLGYFSGLSSVPVTRFLAPVGYDMVWIDWEHTSCNVETMTTVCYPVGTLEELLLITVNSWSTIPCL